MPLNRAQPTVVGVELDRAKLARVRLRDDGEQGRFDNFGAAAPRAGP